MSDTPLPPHVEETVHAVENFHVQHHEAASPVDAFLDGIRATISAPAFIAVLLVLVGLWVSVNVILPSRLRIDPAPFFYLESLLTVCTVLLTILILATQRRADRLASHRERLILQLALVSEQKSAKLISLLEELRRDLPLVPNRSDVEAQQMTEKVDAASVADALRDDDARP